MTVGLPGTGIGGLFYILLCGFMPFFHLLRALKGGHKPHHFKTGIIPMLLSVVIVLSLIGEAKALIWFANKIEFDASQISHVLADTDYSSEVSVLTAISPALALLPFITLFTLIIIIQTLGLLFHGFNRNPEIQEKGITMLHSEKLA